MKSDMTELYSAAVLIAMVSDGFITLGPSWLRTAASAYRASKVLVPWSEVERVLIMDGEVMCIRDGKNYRLCRADYLEVNA
jgi:hypothetical protein